jgi:hypothetical protein
MNKSELKQLIREEISKVTSEDRGKPIQHSKYTWRVEDEVDSILNSPPLFSPDHSGSEMNIIGKINKLEKYLRSKGITYQEYSKSLEHILLGDDLGYWMDSASDESLEEVLEILIKLARKVPSPSLIKKPINEVFEWWQPLLALGSSIGLMATLLFALNGPSAIIGGAPFGGDSWGDVFRYYKKKFSDKKAAKNLKKEDVLELVNLIQSNVDTSDLEPGVKKYMKGLMNKLENEMNKDESELDKNKLLVLLRNVQDYAERIERIKMKKMKK